MDFLARLPFYGVAVLCADDANVRSILPMVSRRVLTYGADADMDLDIRAVDIQACGTQMRFTVLREGHEPLPVVLNLPGRHNVVNSLAAIAIGTLLGVDDAAIQKALAEFTGVGRRFAQYGDVSFVNDHAPDGGTFALVDDYGHHPHEMAATVAAARGAWPQSRLVLAFQPHRYTRTRDCFEDFVRVLSSADAIVLADVYPAGEHPIAGADGRALARALRTVFRGDMIFCATVDEVPQAIRHIVRDGDVVLTMGAGSIGRVPQILTAKSQKRK